MKKRLSLGAMLGLTALLSACSGGNITPSTTHTLTVKLEGVTSAPVTVTNTTTNTQVFSGTLESGKTFSNLKAGEVFKVEGGAVNGFTAPAAQTVTLDADKSATLTYRVAAPPLKASVVEGILSPYRLGAGDIYAYAPLYVVFGTRHGRSRPPRSSEAGKKRGSPCRSLQQSSNG
ncbi:hypothetical protein [Deinococcus aluminii]|uniref:Uncharacterized protein n=1 Tax=Deinococcus aluminii TaxID=1656885 RepID=A0ABP9XAG9_9DEIO